MNILLGVPHALRNENRALTLFNVPSTGEVHLGRNAAIISGMVWLYFFISMGGGGGGRHLSLSWIHICVSPACPYTV